MENVPNVADDIWKELVEASLIEHPTQIRCYYDEVVKKEDLSNPKVYLDFKKPSEMTAEEYLLIPSKSNWNSIIKNCLHSITSSRWTTPLSCDIF